MDISLPQKQSVDWSTGFIVILDYGEISLISLKNIKALKSISFDGKYRICTEEILRNFIENENLIITSVSETISPVGVILNNSYYVVCETFNREIDVFNNLQLFISSEESIEEFEQDYKMSEIIKNILSERYKNGDKITFIVDIDGFKNENFYNNIFPCNSEELKKRLEYFYNVVVKYFEPNFINISLKDQKRTKIYQSDKTVYKIGKEKYNIHNYIDLGKLSPQLFINKQRSVYLCQIVANEIIAQQNCMFWKEKNVNLGNINLNLSQKETFIKIRKLEDLDDNISILEVDDKWITCFKI